MPVAIRPATSSIRTRACSSGAAATVTWPNRNGRRVEAGSSANATSSTRTCIAGRGYAVACRDAIWSDAVVPGPDERARRELEWLREEVATSAGLDDAARVAILEDLWATAEAIRATKSAEQLEREELARQQIDGAGLERYRELARRLES